MRRRSFRNSAPKAATAAGKIVAAGTPEDIVREKRSYTGAFLAPVLARREPKRKARMEARSDP